jgi:hypothetical protein
MKTNELTGSALDWAVAKCEGGRWSLSLGKIWIKGREHTETGDWQPSTTWEQGGPIIERENITLFKPAFGSVEWEGEILLSEDTLVFTRGSTPLIAAMRCYVASKLGDEVDVPE